MTKANGETLTDAMAAWVAQLHTERYPDGCGPTLDRSCEACCVRVGGRDAVRRAAYANVPAAMRDTPLWRAMATILFTNSTRTFLAEHDPKALHQAELALVNPMGTPEHTEACPDCRAKAGW